MHDSHIQPIFEQIDFISAHNQILIARDVQNYFEPAVGMDMYIQDGIYVDNKGTVDPEKSLGMQK